MNKNYPKGRQKILNQSGQSFVEFILLMAVLSFISFVMLRSFNSGIADKWKQIVEIVASPSADNRTTVEIR